MGFHSLQSQLSFQPELRTASQHPEILCKSSEPQSYFVIFNQLSGSEEAFRRSVLAVILLAKSNASYSHRWVGRGSRYPEQRSSKFVFF
jgi:hypothetical protein